MYPQQSGPKHRPVRDSDNEDEGFYDPLESDEGTYEDDAGFEDDDSASDDVGDDEFDDDFIDQDDGESFATPRDEPDDPF